MENRSKIRKYMENIMEQFLFYASIFSYFVSAFTFTALPFMMIIFNMPPLSEARRIGYAILIGMIGIVLQLHKAERQVTRTLLKQQEAPDVRFVGESSLALKELSEKVLLAKKIRNTFVGMSEQHARSNTNELLLRVYENWLHNPSTDEWIDVVGPAQLFSNRYQNVEVDFARKRGVHTLFIIRHSTPIINFIILDYFDGTQEVYFGWISGETSSQRVFASNDKVVIGVFKNHFRKLKEHRLWGEPVVVNYDATVPTERINRADLVDKVGKWLTVSISSGKIRSFGFFKIHIAKKGDLSNEKEGTLTILGNVVDRRAKFMEPIMHGRDEVSHYQNKLFIEFKSRNHSRREGFCFYEFSRDTTLLNPPVSNHKIEGFALSEASSQSVKIYGAKTDTNLDFLDVGDFFECAKLTLETLLNENKISEEQYNVSSIELDQTLISDNQP